MATAGAIDSRAPSPPFRQTIKTRGPTRRVVARDGQNPWRSFAELPGDQWPRALTIVSVIFLASPNSIMVLGRKNNSFCTPA